MDSTYARQGMRQVKSGLGALFGGGGDDEGGGDPLVYVKPKDPSSTRPRTGTKGTGSQQEFIYVSSVPGLFYLNPATKGFEARSNGPTGCVIVGAGISYNLMLYDSNKTTLLTTAITPQGKYQLQSPGGSYVSVTDKDGGTWSIASSQPTQATELLRNICLVLSHLAVHGSPNKTDIPEVGLVVDSSAAHASDAPSKAGDTVSVLATVYSMTTIPSAKPTDITKQPPNVAVKGEKDAKVLGVKEGSTGLGRHIFNMRVGDRRLQLVALSEMMANGDIDPSSMTSVSALSLASGGKGGLYALVDFTVLSVRSPPSAPAPPAASSQQAPVHANYRPPPPPPPPAQSAVDPEAQVADDVPARQEDTADGSRSRSDSVNQASLKERMAKLAVAGRPAVGGASAEVQAMNAVSAVDRRRSSLPGREEADGTTGSSAQAPQEKPQPTTGAPAPATPSPAATSSTAQPAAAAAGYAAPAPAPTPQMSSPPGGMYGGQGQGMMQPYNAGHMVNPMAFMQSMNPMSYGMPSMNIPYGPSYGHAMVVPGVEAVAEGVRSVQSATDSINDKLTRVDGKVDKVLAAMRSTQSAGGGGQGMSQRHLVSQTSLNALTLMSEMPAEGEGEGGNADENGSASRIAAAAGIKIPELIKSLVAVLESAAEIQRQVQEKTNKVLELRRNLTASRKEHEDALNTIDSLTLTRASLLRETTGLKTEKSDVQEQLRATMAALAEANARAAALDAAAKAATAQAEQSAAAAADAAVNEAAARQAAADASQLASTRKDELDRALQRISQLEAEVVAVREQAVISQAEAVAAAIERTTVEQGAQAEATLAERMQEAEERLAAIKAQYRTEALAAIEAAKTSSHASGYAEGHTAGYAEGAADGKEVGHTAGAEEGYGRGNAAGYERGQRTGYQEGHEAGRAEGYADGMKEGQAAGYAKGFEEGKALGREQGHLLGYAKALDFATQESAIATHDLVGEASATAAGSALWQHGKRGSASSAVDVSASPDSVNYYAPPAEGAGLAAEPREQQRSADVSPASEVVLPSTTEKGSEAENDQEDAVGTRGSPVPGARGSRSTSEGMRSPDNSESLPADSTQETQDDAHSGEERGSPSEDASADSSALVEEPVLLPPLFDSGSNITEVPVARTDNAGTPEESVPGTMESGEAVLEIDVAALPSVSEIVDGDSPSQRGPPPVPMEAEQAELPPPLPEVSPVAEKGTRAKSNSMISIIPAERETEWKDVASTVSASATTPADGDHTLEHALFGDTPAIPSAASQHKLKNLFGDSNEDGEDDDDSASPSLLSGAIKRPQPTSPNTSSLFRSAADTVQARDGQLGRALSLFGDEEDEEQQPIPPPAPIDEG